MRVFLSQSTGSSQSAGALSSGDGAALQTSPATITGDLLEVGNLRIGGIKFETVKSGNIQLVAPLKQGVAEFPGPYAPIRVHIPKDTSVFGMITVGKGADGKLRITQINLSLSDPIIIENPASAFLKPANGLAKAAHVIADRFAKVRLEGLNIDIDGAVHLDGKLVKGGVFHKTLEEVMGDSLPKVNLDIRHLLSSLKPGEEDKHLGLKIVKSLARLLNEADFKAQLEIESTSISIQKTDLDFQTEKRGGSGQIQGHITLNEALDFSLTTDPEQSFIDSLLGRILVAATLNVEHPLRESAHIAFKLDGRIDALPNLDVNGHKFSASKARFQAAASADLSTRDNSLMKGNGQFSAELSDPIFRLEDMAVQHLGQIGANLTIRDFVFHNANKAPSFKGSVSAFMRDPKVSREFEADFRLHKSGRVTMSALHHPSALVDLPFHDAYVHQGVLTSHNAQASLSDAEFQAQMEKLTGSRITEGNKVQLLVDGRESLPERLRLINEAKESIWLQTLIFQDDTSGMAIADALAAAAKRGVKVHVIVDGQGSASDLETVILENRAYKVMTDAGVELRMHNDTAIRGLREIIDVIVDNHLSPYTKEELVSGPVTRLISVACRTILKIQKGQLAIPEAQRVKFISGLSKGLGVELSDRISTTQNPILPTDLKGVIQLGGLIDRVQSIIKQIYSWHEKHLIVDGRAAIEGGMNISDPYMFGGYLFKDKHGKITKGWRDTDLLIIGPAVKDAAAAFNRNWHHLTGEQLPISAEVDEAIDGGVKVQVIQHSPSIKGDNNITNFLTAQLNHLKAGETAYFENAYFCPSSTQSAFFDAMINAAKRGVKITVLTNSEMTSDLPAINRAAFHIYNDLLKVGVRIFERSDDRTIHSKIAVIGDVAVVGSANLDNRSARINSEVVAAVYNAGFATRLRDVIKQDLDPRICREITRDKLASVSAADSAHFAAMSLIRDLC